MKKVTKTSTMQIVQTAAKFKEIKADPQLATLGPIQVLLVGRLMQLMERVDEGDTPDRMKRIAEAWRDLQRHTPGLFGFIRNDRDAVKAYNDLNDQIEGAFHDYEAWRQMIQLSDQLRKMGETRMKILKDMKALMSAEEVFEMAGMLLAAVANIVDDPTKLEAISTEFATILGEDYSGGADPRGDEVVDIKPSGVDSGQVLHTGDTGSPDLPGSDIHATVPDSSLGGGVQPEPGNGSL